MTKILRFQVFAAVVCGYALGAQELTPRELFFAAPAIKAKAATRPGRPAPPKTAPLPVEVAKEKTLELAAPPRIYRPPEQIADIVPAALVSSEPPLGLRYSLLLSRGGDEGYKEVDAATAFHSGDRVKVAVETNDAAYLYVLAQGSSGLWNPLFPVSEVAGGDNLIQPFQRYEIPNGGRWYFDQQAGKEKLFIVLSRKPIPNFEDLLYTVTKPADGVRPASGEKPKPSKTFQVAGLNRSIDDALVGRVRSQMQARDLVFEKVDDSKLAPAEKKEVATYVVNRNAGPDGRVLVDLTLEHK